MRAFLSFALLLALACGGQEPATTQTAAAQPSPPPLPPPPAADAARDLVARSPEFSEYQFTFAAYSLPMQQSGRNAPAREAARALAKAGWLGIDGAGTVVLTAKAKNDKRFLVRPNGVVDIVPLARKEMLGVEAVRAAEDGAPLVDFRWRWEPNEVGRLFGDRYAGEQRATATLMWDGSAWSVLRVRPQP